MARASTHASAINAPASGNGRRARRHPAEQLVHGLFTGLGRLRTVLDQLYGPAGLSEHKYLVLTTLAAAAPVPLPPSELARHARVTRSSMTDVLDDLEQRGWVERQRDSSDRRVIRVNLTAAGSAVSAAAEQHFRQICAELLREMSPQELSRLCFLCTTVDRATQALSNRAPVFRPPRA